MEQEIKKINRSIKIYPIFASFTGDLIFFVPIDTLFLTLVKEKLIDSQVLKREDTFNIDVLKELLTKKFEQIDYKNAKEDVEAFIEDKDSLELWSKEFFKEITKTLTVE